MNGMARVIARHPEADPANAFNHKQGGSKIWARQSLFETLGRKFNRIVIPSGSYGMLTGILFDIEAIDTV